MRPSRIAGGLLALTIAAGPVAAVQEQEPGTSYESNLVVGEAPPTTFALESIDDQGFDLATMADRPVLLLFFRGTW